VPRRRLTTSDSVDLAARRWLTSEEPRAAIVLAHGFMAGSDDPAVVAVAEALYERGFDVVTYDARGHGASGGLCTLGDRERHDVAAAVALARLRSDRVLLVGASMGAIAVLRHAADDPHVAGTVIVSCPARWALPRNLRSVLAALLTRTPPGRAVCARWLKVALASRWTNPEPPVELAARTVAPLAVVHGTDDRFIPVQAAQELHSATAEPRRVEVVAGMGHAFDALAVVPILDAVEWVLQRVPVLAPEA